VCDNVENILLACDKLAWLLEALIKRGSPPPLYRHAIQGPRQVFSWGDVVPASNGIDVDVQSCQLHWLLPVRTRKVWTTADSAAYLAVQMQQAASAPRSCPGLYIVVLHKDIAIASDAVDAGFRDHVKEEAGQFFILPRVLPISCSAILDLDQGREAQLRHPRLVSAATVNAALGCSSIDVPQAPLVKQIRTDDPALLWELIDVRLGSMLHFPPNEFRFVIPSCED